MTKQIKIEELIEKMYYVIGDMIINLGNMVDYIKELDRFEAENQRLKAQLNKEIHINRIMLNAINFYANKNFWYDRDDESGWEVAQQTLKQIEEME